jgi:hypothetical protein
MPQPAYNNLCWPQVESDEARRHLYLFSLVRQFLFLSRGSPICSAIFFKLILKNNKFLYFVLSCMLTVCSDTINKNFGNLILNFLTEISIIEGNHQILPQIRIDDVDAESCLNGTAIICPNNLRLIVICRLGKCVRSEYQLGSTMTRHMTSWCRENRATSLTLRLFSWCHWDRQSPNERAILHLLRRIYLQWSRIQDNTRPPFLFEKLIRAGTENAHQPRLPDCVDCCASSVSQSGAESVYRA